MYADGFFLVISRSIFDFRDFESVSVREIRCREKNPPVCINMGYAELIERAIAQTFIPVVDDRRSFIGIVTRTSVMRQLAADMKLIPCDKLFCGQTEKDRITVL